MVIGQNVPSNPEGANCRETAFTPRREEWLFRLRKSNRIFSSSLQKSCTSSVLWIATGNKNVPEADFCETLSE